MGTPHYMSPEQARAQAVDGRTDVFSLGVMLYEMIAGRRPFEGATPTDVIIAVVKTEPPPLTQVAPAAPRELEQIVSRAMRKDREARYQTANDLLADLKDLKDEIDLAAKLQRRRPPVPSSEAATARLDAQEQERKTVLMERLQTEAKTECGTMEDESGSANSQSQVEIPQSKSSIQRSAFIVLPLLVIAIMSAYIYINRSKPVLTNKDTILLAEFDNKTGDAVFDGTLRQGLAVQLQQSPFLNLFPDTRVQQTLRMMERSPDERVTREIGREICQRQGLKALIAGTIAKFEHNYSLTLEALSQTGETIGLTQVEAEGKDQVLKTLSQAASQLREKLGESLGSIRKFDAPLEVTTSSLEALQTYSLGYAQQIKGRFLEAIPFYKRAVELDPNFAYAYTGLAVTHNNTGQPKLAAEYAEKAFALRDRISELEKLRVSHFYYGYATGESDKAIEVLEMFKRTYPRDERGPINLSDRYLVIGQFEKAVAEAQESLRLNPNVATAHGNLGEALINLNRFAEAKETYEQALQQKLDTTVGHTRLYWIACVNEDTAAKQQQLDWARGKPDEYVALDWQTGTAAFAGQWRRAQDFSHRAIDLATRSDVRGVAARYAAEQALRAAVFGQFTQAKTSAAQSLARERNQVSLTRAALALALCGAPSQTQPLVDELVKRYPKDTIINGLWLPVIKAALEMQRGNAAQAIESLETARRYEAATEFWPQHVRGQAYLKFNKGAEAAAEFQKILDHRGQAPLSALYPLAHLGLARAAMLTGDTAKAQKSYQDFFALWKDADADLPILIEAKKGYEKVK